MTVRQQIVVGRAVGVGLLVAALALWLTCLGPTDLPLVLSGEDITVREDTPPMRPSALAILAVSASLASSAPAADAVFPITLNRPATGEVTFDYATRDGTALAESDYIGGSGVASIAEGDAMLNIRVPIINDTDDEPDETFDLVISNVRGAGLIGADETGARSFTCTIEDDDEPPPPPPLMLDGSDVRVREGD